MNKNPESKLNRIRSQIISHGAWDSILEDINNDVLLSGKPLDTLALMNNTRKLFLITGILIFPLSIYLFLELSPIFLGLNFIWIMLFAYPKFHQKNLSQERKKKVEEELSTFVIFSSVMQNVGIGLYDSFQLFRDTDIFKAISKEAMLLKRNVEYFGLSQMEALEELGRTHRSELFKNLLLGYTSIWRSGGDLSLYLEDRADEFFTYLKERYKHYTNNVGTIGEILVTLLLILPILIMVASFILPGGSLEQITLFATIGLPIFAILMSVVIATMQPATFNSVGLSQVAVAVLGGIGLFVGIGVYTIYNEIWLSVALGIVIPSTISAVIAGRYNNEIYRAEQYLPQFLRDMTEYKKIGYDVNLALIHLSGENLYSSLLNKRLDEASILLKNGTAPTTVVKAIQFRSWFTKISFYLLGYTAEFGGGTPKTLETINKFITNAKQVVKEGKSEISSLTLIIFAAPVIMAFTGGMILNMLGSFDTSLFEIPESSGEFGGGGLSSNFINLITITPAFLEMIKTLIVTSSLLGAFVITKAIDFTFYNTWRVVVIGLISIVSIMFMENFTATEFELDSLLGNLNPDSLYELLGFR